MDWDRKSIEKGYRENIDRYLEEERSVKKISLTLAIARLVTFVLLFGLPYLFRHSFTGIPILLGVLFLFAFGSCVYYSNRIKSRLKQIQNHLDINRGELAYLSREFGGFDNGNEFIDAQHSYSFDLDLFGDHSLFQSINRTSTNSGKKRLATLFLDPLQNIDEIECRQEALEELAFMQKWRHTFLAYARSYEDTEKDMTQIESWNKDQIEFKHEFVYKWSKWPLIACSLLGLLLVCIEKIAFSDLIYFVLPQAIYWGVKSREIAKFFYTYGKTEQLLDKYIKLLEHIKGTEFQSTLLQSYQKKLFEEDKAIRSIKQLKKINSRFNQRCNMIMGILINLFLLNDITCCYRLYLWQRKHGGQLTEWIDSIATFDAFVSLANFVYNNPHHHFPKFDDNAILDIQDAGHPLLEPKMCVTNSFSIDSDTMAIITGANMAGKSTFLRTIGLNLVLAQIGTTTYCRKMVLRPLSLFSYMRASDDLSKNESYFFAELKRLQSIKNHVKSVENSFVILDEILRGTNSEDKLNGSKKYLQKLISYGGKGIVATHDLKLTELEKESPRFYKNYCFEIELTPQELHFDYKISPGVTTAMNASFLMKKMGIIDEE